jgi:hypothetical protein
MSETKLTVIESDPAEVVASGNSTAKACKAIILQNTMILQGKRWIKAEGWQALAAACDYSPRIDVVEELANGDIRAVCSLIRLSDGVVVASAEGYIGTDEPTWKSRQRYAKRAMAQTRAVSRACRSALAWIIPLLDAGLETTPAEEVEHLAITAKPSAPVVVEAAKADPKAELLAKLTKAITQAANKQGIPGKDIGEQLRQTYGVASSKDLSIDQLNEAITSLNEILQGA